MIDELCDLCVEEMEGVMEAGGRSSVRFFLKSKREQRQANDYFIDTSQKYFTYGFVSYDVGMSTIKERFRLNGKKLSLNSARTPLIVVK